MALVPGPEMVETAAEVVVLSASEAPTRASGSNGTSIDEEAPFYVLGWAGVVAKALVVEAMPPPATVNALNILSIFLVAPMRG